MFIWDFSYENREMIMIRETIIFLLRNNGYKLNWCYEYNIQKQIVQKSYPNIHLHINYVQLF